MRLCETDSQGCMMRMACGDCECPEEASQEETVTFLAPVKEVVPMTFRERLAKVFNDYAEFELGQGRPFTADAYTRAASIAISLSEAPRANLSQALPTRDQCLSDLDALEDLSRQVAIGQARRTYLRVGDPDNGGTDFGPEVGG